MTTGGVTAVAARRTLLLLTFTRWFPVGLTAGVSTLLAVERGMSLAQVAVIFSVQGFVLLGLEVPTGGLADAIGRRPVLIAASSLALVAGLMYVQAHTFTWFIVALVLMGVFRALDSGSLEAWYVDAAQAHTPGVNVESGLSASGTMLGAAIATGALISGGLIAWHPVHTMSALALPYWVALGFYALNIAAIGVLLREERPHIGTAAARTVLVSARSAPATVRASLRTMARARVLRTLIAVEVFWSTGMIAFEIFIPVRLAEVAGGQVHAGALMGALSAAAWGLYAGGSAAAGWVAQHIGVAWAALAARVLNGMFIVFMGLAGGPVALICAYMFTYTLHGSANPVHNTLLHRQAGAENRATILSMNSMVGGASFSVGLLVLGPLAAHLGTAVGIVAAGAFSILGAVMYLPAITQERAMSPVQRVVD